ncbi:MAG: Formate efflux transporter (TC 2.A.44 family), partial [uncultured Friedmanniella sp.]
DREDARRDRPSRRRHRGEEGRHRLGQDAARVLPGRRLHLLRRDGGGHRLVGPRPGGLGHPADAVHRHRVHPRPGPRAHRRLEPAHGQHAAGPDQRPRRPPPRAGRRAQPRPGAAGQRRRGDVRRLLPRGADRRHRQRRRRGGDERGDDVRAARRHRRDQGAARELVADLPARARRQLARVPRRLDGHRVGRRERQDPRDVLPGHGVRGDGLRPRRRQHVLPAGRDLRRHAGPRLGGRAAQLVARLRRQPRRGHGLRGVVVLVPLPQGRARGRHPRGL